MTSNYEQCLVEKGQYTGTIARYESLILNGLQSEIDAPKSATKALSEKISTLDEARKNCEANLDSVVKQQNSLRNSQAEIQYELKSKVNQSALDSRSMRGHDHQQYQARIQNIEKELANHVGTQSRVYFTAYSKTSFEGSNVIIPFPMVYNQEGDGYDATTGVFTAKEPGVYFIFASLLKYHDKALKFWIYHNDKRVGRGYDEHSGDSYNQVSCGVTLLLAANDRVYLFMENGKYHAHTNYPSSTFTCFKIN